MVFKRRAALRARAAPPLVRQPRWAQSNFGTVRTKLCRNWIPCFCACLTPVRTILAESFVSVGKVMFFSCVVVSATTSFSRPRSPCNSMVAAKIFSAPSAPMRWRKCTSSLASHGAPHCNSCSPQKNCAYALKLQNSTTRSSLKSHRCFSSKSPTIRRIGKAGRPSSL